MKASPPVRETGGYKYKELANFHKKKRLKLKAKAERVVLCVSGELHSIDR